MRCSQLKRLLIKMIVMIYLIFIASTYLTSNTEAQFIDITANDQLIQAGEWWDGSSIKILDSDHYIANSCGTVQLQVDILNESSKDMYDASIFEVYQVNEMGDIVAKISRGTMYTDVMAGGESSRLTYMVDKPGDYMFKVYQRPGYDENYDVQTSVVSGIFTVNCQESIEIID